ncbi:MAG: NAD-dependent epimerase/dehydratase family protein [Nitrospira sp.]|nr:SDR family oxidoreductase [Nitrospinaceae bacterium]
MSNVVKTVLVTGATGFIGSHLTRRLVREGWNVHAIVRPGSNLHLLKTVRTKVSIHVHDETTEGMLKILEAAKPDIVFHLASFFLAKHKPKDINPLLESNLIFGTQLVEAMVEHKVFSLITTGTSWQHYENKEYSPVCLYAATKQAFEDIVQYYVEACSLKVITLKLFDTYGPDDPRAKLFALIKKVAENGEQLNMSDGEQLIDLVYIDDVIEAFLVSSERFIQQKVSGYERYVITSGKPISLREVVALYSKVICKEVNIIWGGRPYRDREVMIPWDKGVLLPNWLALVPVEEGLRRIINRS